MVLTPERRASSPIKEKLAGKLSSSEAGEAD
jgi:hypothetical protein